MSDTPQHAPAARINTYLVDLKKTVDSLDPRQIQQAVDVLHQARLDGRQVFVMGNGGSASTASHMVCDLAKNTRQDGWPHLRVIGLTDNMAILSAFSNDEGYENAFMLQLVNLVQPGDVVIAISTSGNSPNVVRAVEAANEHQAYTIGLTGFDGGQLSRIVDLQVHVPNDCVEQVEDIHLMLQHMITTMLREMAPARP